MLIHLQQRYINNQLADAKRENNDFPQVSDGSLLKAHIIKPLVMDALCESRCRLEYPFDNEAEKHTVAWILITFPHSISVLIRFIR